MTALPSESDSVVRPVELSEADRRAALAKAVRDSLRPAAGGLAVVYVVAAVSHFYRVDPPAQLPLGLLAAVSAVFFIAFAVFMRPQRVPVALVHALAASLALLTLANEFLQQRLLGDASLQVYNTIFLLGIGIFFTSTGWLILCTLLSLACWGFAAWEEGSHGQIIEWAYAHTAAVALGFGAHLARRRTIARMEGLRLSAEAQARKLHAVVEELRGSEVLFRQFADHSGQSFWINDGKTHQVAYINRVYETLYGRPIDRLHDDPLDWLAAVHPEDRARVNAAYLACVSTGRFDERYRIIRPDGVVRWVHDHGFRIGDAAEGRIGGITRDVTERVLAEQQLIASRQRLTDLIADIDGVVWECDPYTFRYSYVSPRAEAILGYPLADWLTDPAFFTGILHGDDRARVVAVRAARVAAGADFELHYRVLAADGRDVWVHDKVRLVRDGSGNIDRLRGIMVDVTGSMRVAQALRDSQEVLDKAQNIAHLGSWSYDRQQPRVVWSAQMYAIHGVTPAEFDGSWMFALQMVHPEDQQHVWKACEQAVAGGARAKDPEPLEYRIVRPDGSHRYVRAQAELHYDEAGELLRVIGTLQDITDVREAEADRRRLEEELRQVQKLEAVGTLASGVAHDFNNLLTAIDGYADLVGKALPRVHPARPSLEMIKRATDQAAGVTRGLLTFAHRTPFKKKPTDLAPNIRQSVQLLRRLLPASIAFTDDLPGDGEIWVNADGYQLQQVWLNLVVNARDSMPRGGKIALNVGRFAEGPVNPEDSWHGQAIDAVVITISDTGEGMDEATIARIFEPYFTTKPRGQGTGLGLPIVHGIIADHGGRIRVQSQPGAGTRFSIYLPCCPPPDEGDATERSAAATQGRGETILFAEDNEFVRAIVASTLEAAGYRVIQAIDGAAAMQEYTRHRGQLALVIMDLDLPQQSGADCIERIRAAGDAVPILIVTGNASLATGGAAVKDLVLVKPFPIARLIEVVNERVAGGALAE